MKTRVAFFLSNFKSGGTEWFALRLARGLTRHGLDPLFLVAQAQGELMPMVAGEFPIVPLSGWGYSPLGIARALPGLIRFLAREKPDVVISGLPLLNVALALALKFTKARPHVVMVEHMRLCPSGECPGCWRHRLKVRLLGFAYAMADDVVSVSQTAAQDLAHFARIPAAKAKIISNPVIPDNFEELVAETPPHPWLAHPGERPVLLAVGRLLGVKDYPTLLRAFALARQKKDMALVILGEGIERAKLEALIADLGLGGCVALAGAKPNVFCAMKAASLFVLSSTSEAFGNVIVEALACGTPVVSTDCGGPREILEDGRFGRLVEPGQPEALAAALLEALAAPVDRAALRERGLAFSVEKATQAYLKLIGNKR